VSQHLTKTQILRLSAKTLPKGQLAIAGEHFSKCETCLQQFQLGFQRIDAGEDGSFTLEPEYWFRLDHLQFEDLVKFADNSFGSSEKEIVNVHLRSCEECREDLRAFQGYRKETQADLQLSYGPISPPRHQASSSWSWLPQNLIRPSYLTMLLIIGAFTFGLLVALNRDSRTTITANNALPRATPSDLLAENPSPPVVGSEDLPLPVVTINDSQGPVTLRSDHSVTGLDQISPGTRKEVAEVLLTQKLKMPSVFKYLRDEDGTLRGREKSKETFRLLAPKTQVLIENRPLFRWEALTGASTYQVSILNSNGHEVGKSHLLSGTTAQWRPAKSLTRGQVYSWVVVAKIGDMEVASPSASSREIRFAILSTRHLQELNQLRADGSYLALGVFYSKAGLIKEAEREFQRLRGKNPDSPIPTKFLVSLRYLH